MDKWEYREVMLVDKWAFWWEAPGKDQNRPLAFHRPSGIMGFKRTFRIAAPILQELGEEGWELVAVNPLPDSKSDTVLFFKRPKQ